MKPASFQAARLAAESLGEKAPLFYSWQDEAYLIIDIHPVLSKKIEATLYHRSQHTPFVHNTERRTGRKTTIPEVVMSVESLHRHLP